MPADSTPPTQDFADGRAPARPHRRAAGEALSLLGRAQVAIAAGGREHATPFLTDALLMARESEVGHHTLDRIYGAMVEAATDTAQGLERRVRGRVGDPRAGRDLPDLPHRVHRPGDDRRRAGRRPGTRAPLRGRLRAGARDRRPAAGMARGGRGGARLARARQTAAPTLRASTSAGAAEGFRTWGQPLDASAAPSSPRA